MQKIILALVATAAVVFTSCVKNDPYVEPKGSELQGVLFFNEVNGTGIVPPDTSANAAEKYVEMYNNSDADISLEGFIVDYGGRTSWTGRAADTVPAHGYFLIKGTKTTYPGMSTGLSANNGNVNMTLFDTNGGIVDYYEKIPDTNAPDPLEDMDHMRIPDGGTWYYVDLSARSPGATNLSDPSDPAVKGPMPPMEKKLTIESVTVTPTIPTIDDDVNFAAKVTDVNVISSVVLKWKLNGADQADISMNKNNADGLYEATITKQAAGTVVDWTVVATNNKGNSDYVTGTITWTAQSIDYSKLKLNEVSGVGTDADKFYELINTGGVDIPLGGCQIYYNANAATGGTLPTGDGNLTWTGLSTQIATAGGLFCLIGRDNPAGTSPGSFTTGLTAARILIITLKDPAGNVIDQCVRAEDTGDYAFTDKSFSRIPDGTGPFYFTTPSPNVLNGTDATGLILVPTQPEYLVLNEVDGNGKFVEIYNKGTEAVSLAGVSLVKNESAVWWTGAAGVTISAGGYYVIAQSGGTTIFDENTGASGISPKQTVKFELKNSSGNVIDQFSRGVTPWGTTISDVTPNSFSRCPNGTGDFKLATPSPKAANPATGDDIPQS
ncbi:MAG: lamin tail domain-containing protein [Paludibacter sp.]|nr:lamin tail domain-containing protein [Paludibacter sp.]